MQRIGYLQELLHTFINLHKGIWTFARGRAAECRTEATRDDKYHLNGEILRVEVYTNV